MDVLQSVNSVLEDFMRPPPEQIQELTGQFTSRMGKLRSELETSRSAVHLAPVEGRPDEWVAAGDVFITRALPDQDFPTELRIKVHTELNLCPILAIDRARPYVRFTSLLEPHSVPDKQEADPQLLVYLMMLNLDIGDGTLGLSTSGEVVYITTQPAEQLSTELVAEQVSQHAQMILIMSRNLKAVRGALESGTLSPQEVLQALKQSMRQPAA